MPVNDEPAPIRSEPPGVPSDSPAAIAALSDPERWVDEHGDYLFRYALMRLRDETKAEDMVQETFLAALKGGKSFQGRSAEKSWLVGILKNKIVDYFRKASRETSFTDVEFFKDGEREPFEESGMFQDCWNHDRGPGEWSEPGAALDAEAFWKVFESCTQKLPRNVARVFLLREMDDVASDAICEQLSISPNNLWVMLHRARAALRRCLEMNWFSSMTPPQH